MTNIHEILEWLANKYGWNIVTTYIGPETGVAFKAKSGSNLTVSKVAAEGMNYILDRYDGKDMREYMDAWARKMEQCLEYNEDIDTHVVYFPHMYKDFEDYEVISEPKPTYSIAYRTVSKRDFLKGCTRQTDTQIIMMEKDGSYLLRFKDKGDQNRTILGVVSAQIVEECDPACIDMSAPTYTIIYRGFGLSDTLNGCKRWKDKNASLYKLENNGLYTLRFVDAFGQKQVIAGIDEAQIIETKPRSYNE